MAALVETTIWSLAYRRKPANLNAEESLATAALDRIIRNRQARIIGPIRQELLSGVRDPKSFDRLLHVLRAFEDEPIVQEDFEEAARLANKCLTAGIAISSVDMLICAVGIRRGWEIYTVDQDFERYARILPLALYQPRS